MERQIESIAPLLSNPIDKSYWGCPVIYKQVVPSLRMSRPILDVETGKIRYDRGRKVTSVVDSGILRRDSLDRIPFLIRPLRRLAGWDLGFRSRWSEGAGHVRSHAKNPLEFSARPFPGHQKKLTWLRGDSGGKDYKLDDPPREGWICPAMFRYYETPPPALYVKTEPLRR